MAQGLGGSLVAVLLYHGSFLDLHKGVQGDPFGHACFHAEADLRNDNSLRVS